ncbi:hypothetical protein ACFX19_030109 [Malus domestica]
MFHPMNSTLLENKRLSTSPLLSSSTVSTTRSSSTTHETDESPSNSGPFSLQDHVKYQFPCIPLMGSFSYRSLAMLSGHVGPVLCLALCGEFILSPSQGKDIIVWQ